MKLPDVLMVLLVKLLTKPGQLPPLDSLVPPLMVLGLPLKLVELLWELKVLLLLLVDLLLDLNKNITSEPLVKMPQVTSIKKLPQSKFKPQIMVVKLLFLLILSHKVTLNGVTLLLTSWFSIWPVLYLKDLLFQFTELLMTPEDIVVLPHQVSHQAAEEEES